MINTAADNAKRLLWILLSTGIAACAGAGTPMPNASTGTSDSQPAQTETKTPVATAADEGAPINYLCACRDLLDGPSRGTFVTLKNEDVRLQANCVFVDGSNRDHYLSITVYQGSRSTDFEAAVARARRGYETISDARSEVAENPLRAGWFAGSGTKSKVIGTVVLNEAKQLIIESREVLLGTGVLAIPEHAAAQTLKAASQASWVCKKP